VPVQDNSYERSTRSGTTNNENWIKIITNHSQGLFDIVGFLKGKRKLSGNITKKEIIFKFSSFIP
jgi:hypothetical protein